MMMTLEGFERTEEEEKEAGTGGEEERGVIKDFKRHVPLAVA